MFNNIYETAEGNFEMKGDKIMYGNINFRNKKGEEKMSKKAVNTMNKVKAKIPAAFLGVSEDPDVASLRQMLEGHDDVELREDGTLSTGGSDKNKKQAKKGVIPKGVLGVDEPENDIPEELISEFRHKEDKQDENDKPAKKGVIPKGVLGALCKTEEKVRNVLNSQPFFV